MQSAVLLLLVSTLGVSALNTELHDITITGSQIGGGIHLDGNHGDVRIEGSYIHGSIDFGNGCFVANNSIHECDGTVRPIDESELQRLRKHQSQLGGRRNSKNRFRNKSKGRQVAGVKAQSRRRPTHGRVASVAANKKHNPFNRNNRRGRNTRNRRNNKRAGRRQRGHSKGRQGQTKQNNKPDAHWPATISPCNTCNKPHEDESSSGNYEGGNSSGNYEGGFSSGNYEGGYTSDSYQEGQYATQSYNSYTGYYEATTGSSF